MPACLSATKALERPPATKSIPSRDRPTSPLFIKPNSSSSPSTFGKLKIYNATFAHRFRTTRSTYQWDVSRYHHARFYERRRRVTSTPLDTLQMVRDIHALVVPLEFMVQVEIASFGPLSPHFLFVTE